MRKSVLFTAVSTVVALCLQAACGSDGETTCTTGAGNNGGSGGQGGGTPGTAAIGAHCKTHGECADGICLAEELTGWGTGYCTASCNEFLPCPEGSMCITGAPAFGTFCLTECDPAGSGADCQSAQSCYDLGDGVTGLCVGGCTTAADCPDMGNCDTANGVCACVSNAGCPTLGNCEPDGLCYVPEICNNQLDDEGDGLMDCEDADDCGTDATCQSGIATACGGAVDVSAGGTFDGQTQGGTNLFAGNCADLFGSYTVGSGMNERVYVYTAAAAGVLGLKVTTSAGSVDWYVQSACDDPATNLGCLTGMAAGDAPVTGEVAVGDVWYIIVDGQGGDATFTLDVTLVDPATVCTAATTITVGSTTGNNTTGSAAFRGSCGGSYGTENVYSFTPATTGDLTVTMTPTDTAGDPVLYVRTNCNDDQSEPTGGCVDENFEGEAETVTVPVTSGTPIYIFADSYTPGPYTLTLSIL
jgi:hypothetical protein